MIKSVKCDAVLVLDENMLCSCGGVFEVVGGTLLSNPPKHKVECRFCGETNYVINSSIKISFKVTDESDKGDNHETK